MKDEPPGSQALELQPDINRIAVRDEVEVISTGRQCPLRAGSVVRSREDPVAK
jgi:hypothetical protein